MRSTISYKLKVQIYIVNSKDLGKKYFPDGLRRREEAGADYSASSLSAPKHVPLDDKNIKCLAKCATNKAGDLALNKCNTNCLESNQGNALFLIYHIN